MHSAIPIIPYLKMCESYVSSLLVLFLFIYLFIYNFAYILVSNLIHALKPSKYMLMLSLQLFFSC